MTFDEPIKVSQPAGISFEAPQPAAQTIQFDAPTVSPAFDKPVDVLSEGADIKLFEQWKSQQKGPSVGETVDAVATSVGKGIWDTVKVAGEAAFGLARDALDPTINDTRGERTIAGAKKLAATAAEAGAEAFKGSAILGDYVKTLFAKSEAAKAKATDTPGGVVSMPEGVAEQRRIDALKTERKFYRDLRDLSSASNDGRLIAQQIFDARTNQFAETPVSQESAQLIGGFISDPAIAASLATTAGRKVLTTVAAETALRQAPFTGDIGLAERAVASALAKRTETESALVAARSAGDEAPQLAGQLAKDEAAFQEANRKFAEMQKHLAEQAAAVEQDLGKSTGQKILGKTIEAAGAGVRKAGDAIEELHQKIHAAAEAVSQGDVTGTGILAKAGQKILPDFLKEGVGATLQGAGDFAREAGRIMAAKESSLPYFQSLSRALPEGSVGRWAASQAERVEFLASTGRWVMDTGSDVAKGTAVGAVFGTLNNDPVGGATQGAIFGMAGSQFGQFAKFNSPAEVWARQKVDIEMARQRAERRGEPHLKAFDSLTDGEKLLVATFEQAHPDLAFNLTSKDGVSWYDFNGAVGEIGLDPRSPLAGAITHEVKHHIGRNPEIAQAVETRLLGDPEAGIPGIFTARDADGKPIVIELPDAQNPEIVRRQFKLSDEFYKVRDEYLQLLRNKGLPTADYERSDKLIAHEIWAESETANLLHRQANGEFDAIAVQRMGPVRRALADAIDGSELVGNSAFLQRVLAKAGITFNAFSGDASSTGLFSDSLRVPGMQNLVKKYYEKNDREKRVGTDSDSFGVKHYTEAEILKSPQLMEQFGAGFDVVRDPVSGKYRFIGEKEAKARAREFFDTLVKELESDTSDTPGKVRRVEAVEGDGRKTVTWVGTAIPENVITRMEESGRFNEVQLNNLRALSKLLPQGRGNEVNMFYQPASKRGGKVYRTRPITERTESPMSIRLTQDGNVVINTISQEKLQRNLVDAFKKGQTIWPDYQTAWADVQTYLKNHASGLPGDASGLGEVKRDFINSLFGQLTKDQRDFNPFLEAMSEKSARNLGIVQSRRLDRINKMFVLSSEFKPDYGKVSRNFSPAPSPQSAAETISKPGNYWVDPQGEVYPVKSHESFAREKLGGVGSPTDELVKRGWLRVVSVAGGDNAIVEGRPSPAQKRILNEVPLAERGLGVMITQGRGSRFVQFAEPGKQFSPGAKDQPLEGSLGKGELRFTHYSNQAGLTNLDPKNFGKSGVTPKSEFAGLPRTYAYVEGSKLGQDKGLIDTRANKYTGSVPKGKIYDGVNDPLDYHGMINREKADQMLVDKGFVGIYREGRGGVKQVEFFSKVPLDKPGKQFSPGLTEAQKQQVESPEFKKWFGDSKVVDENGDPLVVYHGTDAKFSVFATKKLGAWFTNDETFAKRWGENVIPAFVSLKNPYIYENSGYHMAELDSPRTIRELKADGYDGVVVRNDHDRLVNFAVFEPTQIKSATGNNGSFDPTNPDIRYSPGGKVGVAPLRTTAVDNFGPKSLEAIDEPLKKLQATVETAAKRLGLDVTVNRVIGGWQDTETNVVSREGSLRITVKSDATPDQLRALAAFAGENAPEKQNAVMVFEPGDGDWVEHAIGLKDSAAAEDITSRLRQFNLGDGFSFDPQSSTLYLVTPAADEAVAKVLDYAKSKDTFRSYSFDLGTAEFPGSDRYAELIRPHEKDLAGSNLPAPDGQAQLTVPGSTVSIRKGAEKLDLGPSPSVLDIAGALAARSRKAKRIPYDSRTPGAKDAAATILADEISFAAEQDRNAIGWYERKIGEAMSNLTKLHPELADENTGAFYKAILAITSNGQDVVSNFTRAEELYRNWKEVGRLDTSSQWGGARAAQINDGLAKLQALVDMHGLEGTREFLMKEFRFGDIKKLAKSMLGIELGASEPADHVVRGSVIFGPKVGGGFFPNLMGDFSPVTMDLWLMRTWNRVNGSYGVSDQVGMGRALARLRAAATENPGLPDAAAIGKMSDRQLGNWAEKRFADWKGRRKFKDADPFDRPAKAFAESKAGEAEAPRNGSERAWIREIFKEIDKKLAERGLPAINNADKQALLWYYEKDLYTALGYRNNRGQPADYADAARKVLETYGR